MPYRWPLEREFYDMSSSLPQVDIVTCYLRFDGKYLEAAVEIRAKGIIIESTERGHVFPEVVDMIEQNVNKSTVVVLTT